MALSEQLPLADVKNRLSSVVDQVEREHDRVVVTKHGRPAVIILSIDDFESLEETLAILSVPGLLAEIRTGLEEEAVPLSREEALGLISEAGG